MSKFINVAGIVVFLVSTAVVGIVALSSPVYGAAGNKKDIENLSEALHLTLTPAEKKWLSQHHTVRLAGPRAFPPFYFHEPDGTVKGMAMDYVSFVFDALGLSLDIQADIPWSEVLRRAANKEIDVIGCAAKTPDRQAYLKYTDPVLSFPLVIITRTDGPFMSGLQDLHDKKVAFVKGNAVFDWVSDIVPVTPYFVTTPLDALEAVAFDNAQAHIDNLAAATYLIRKKGLTNLKIAAPTFSDNYNLYMGIRRDWSPLVSMVNKVLATKTTVQHTSIRNRWLSVESDMGLSRRRVIQWFLGISITAFVLIAAVLVWNRRLGREIRERQRAEKSLMKSRKKWQDIFNAIGHPAMILDRRHRIENANNAALKLTGLTREQIRGQRCHTLFHGSDKPPGKCPMEALMSGGALDTVEMFMETVSGHFLVSCTPVLDENGTLDKVIHIATDITEKVRLEHQLRQSHKMEAVGTLSGGIAHEFNNILGIIMGNSEMAMDDISEDEPAREFLSEVKKASLRGRDVVRQLLSFSRKDSHEKQVVDMPVCIREAVKLMRAYIPSQIEFKLVLVADCRPVLADRTQIQQMVINLCNNAAHAMEEKGGVLTIGLENKTLDSRQMISDQTLLPGEYVRLSVTDTGHGISEDVMDHLFEPFFTTKAVDKGTGMGLSVVHGIVTGHGGGVIVESKPGRGSTFYCYLPATDIDVLLAEEGVAALPRGSETILFVDDDPAMMKMGKDRLERLGYTVEGFTSPLGAAESVAADPHRFDLVITDMAMPGMTGDQLLHHLLDIRPDIKVIVCTGYSKKMDAEVALQLGAVGFIMKPVGKKDLAEIVRRTLDDAVSGTPSAGASHTSTP